MRILAAVMSNMFHNSVLQKQGNFFKLFLDTEHLTKRAEDTLRGKTVLLLSPFGQLWIVNLKGYSKGTLHPKVKILSIMQSQMYMTFFCRTRLF